VASAEGDEGMWWVGEGTVGSGPGGERSREREERGGRGAGGETVGRQRGPSVGGLART
jgi:hypothetical protein